MLASWIMKTLLTSGPVNGKEAQIAPEIQPLACQVLNKLLQPIPFENLVQDYAVRWLHTIPSGKATY